MIVKQLIICVLIMVSTATFASRVKATVQFDLTNASQTEAMIPFTVVAPESYAGLFVRFVHPKNGKSAVAKVVDKKGDRYITNPEVAQAIGIYQSLAPVFIEAVY
jgi:uncharacterized protein (DUF2141 family)